MDPSELERIDGWWRAANYLSVGQIYVLDNVDGIALRRLLGSGPAAPEEGRA